MKPEARSPHYSFPDFSITISGPISKVVTFYVDIYQNLVLTMLNFDKAVLSQILLAAQMLVCLTSFIQTRFIAKFFVG